MDCSEIKECVIDILYDEDPSASAGAEVQDHLRTCAACREELDSLRQTRKYLQSWKEEPPLRSARTTGLKAIPHQGSGWRYWRYAAIAAMAAICFLALANAQITWNKNGFSFSTRLFAGGDTRQDYYTKAELRDLMKQALNESEDQINETTYMMMHKLLDKVEQDRWMDLRYIRSYADKKGNGN